MIEAFLPDMIAANHGHICAIGSMTSLVGSANLVPYSASKFAVRGAFFTQSSRSFVLRGENALKRHQTRLVCGNLLV
jgi:short-subunit dehydrogenase